MTLLDTALAMHGAGLAVVPIAGDGTKRPAVAWKQYQEVAPGAVDMQRWFAKPADHGGYQGLGVLTGPVSGQLEMLEVEGRAVDLVVPLTQLLNDSGLGDLWSRLCTGWMERSPSGGMHWLFRVDGDSRPNTKLARRPSTPEELEAHKAGEREKTIALTATDAELRDKRLTKIDALTPYDVPQVLIETRGAGGFVVTAPSNGRSHTTGQPWTLLAGGPATIPVLTLEERDALYLACSTFDQMQVTDPLPAPAPSSTPASTSADGVRPGDDYAARTSWDDILVPRGWTKGRQIGPNTGWTRPGKHPREGISATTSDVGLYVFSTSTEFESEVPYSKFGAYAVLEHGGDHAAAARELRRDGYGGEPPEEARPVDVYDLVGNDEPDSSPAPDMASESPETAPGRAAVEARAGEVPTTYTLTDDGNALRLVDAYGNQLRYCPQRGQWLTWGAHRWIWDEAEHVHELARQVARGLPAGGRNQDKHRGRSLSTAGVLAMTRLARSDARAVVHLNHLDAQPYQLNTPGGVINLRTGQLLAPDPSMLHTRSTNAIPAEAYEPGDAPRWERFLADTFAGDPDLTTYLQRVLGQSLIGAVLEQILPFAFGVGANGKTTLLGVVQRLIGIGDQGYAISAPADLLLATANPGHPTEIARLAGARLVVTSELEDGQRFAEAKVKMLTGRDTISGRFMRQDWFSFTPTHTLFLLANHQPEVRAGGEAFWRRIALLPFLHTVPPADRNPHLEDELVEHEGSQILSWIVQGAVDYLGRGIARPDSVEAATTSYATAQDTVGRFVDDCCDLGTPGTQTYAIASSELRQAYESWCRQEGETPVSAKALGMTLISRFGVTSKRTRTGRLLDGVRLHVDLANGSQEPEKEDQLWMGE